MSLLSSTTTTPCPEHKQENEPQSHREHREKTRRKSRVERSPVWRDCVFFLFSFCVFVSVFSVTLWFIFLRWFPRRSAAFLGTHSFENPPQVVAVVVHDVEHAYLCSALRVLKGDPFAVARPGRQAV